MLHFSLTHVTVDHQTLVLLHGEIDRSVRDEIDSALNALPADVTTVHLSFDAVSFMDSSGLALLDEQRGRMRKRDGRLSVSGLRAQPLRLLHSAAKAIPDGEWEDFLPQAQPAGTCAEHGFQR